MSVATPITFDARELHVALCTRAGIDPGHGSKSAISNLLGTTRQWYGRVLAGEGTTANVLEWCARVGVRVEMTPAPWESDGGGHLSFSLPAVLPDVAYVIVRELQPHQGGGLEAVITRQTGGQPGEVWRHQLPPDVEMQIPQALEAGIDTAGSGFVATSG